MIIQPLTISCGHRDATVAATPTLHLLLKVPAVLRQEWLFLVVVTGRKQASVRIGKLSLSTMLIMLSEVSFSSSNSFDIAQVACHRIFALYMAAGTCFYMIFSRSTAQANSDLVEQVFTVFLNRSCSTCRSNTLTKLVSHGSVTVRGRLIIVRAYFLHILFNFLYAFFQLKQSVDIAIMHLLTSEVIIELSSLKREHGSVDCIKTIRAPLFDFIQVLTLIIF